MSILANRRSVMTLYSDACCPIGHAVRLVLAEKDINVEIHYVEPDNVPEDLNDLNPYGSILTLIDRDLVLYDAQIIMEYLDERFPHPPLMPVDPVSRANNRQLRFRIKRDLYDVYDELESGNDIAAANAKKKLRDNLTSVAPAFTQHQFFMSDDFSLVDCYLVPLLWRLDTIGIKLPSQAKPLSKYAERLFQRDAFQSSLSPAEREIRDK
jgi:RNA polymerase-associated protein